MFRHSMFGVFEVRYFGVHSKTSSSLEKEELLLLNATFKEIFPLMILTFVLKTPFHYYMYNAAV